MNEIFTTSILTLLPQDWSPVETPLMKQTTVTQPQSFTQSRTRSLVARHPLIFSQCSMPLQRERTHATHPFSATVQTQAAGQAQGRNVTPSTACTVIAAIMMLITGGKGVLLIMGSYLCGDSQKRKEHLSLIKIWVNQNIQFYQYVHWYISLEHYI